MNRLALAGDWPLAVLFGDKITPLRRVVDEFIRSPMEKAISDWQIKQARKGDEKEDEVEKDANLLTHLVRHTQDPEILKDELVSLLVAGRDTVGLFQQVSDRTRADILLDSVSSYIFSIHDLSASRS